MYLYLNGLGAEKKKKEEKPVVPQIQPIGATVSPSALPKWMPYAVGAAGFAVIVLLLLTSKGKD